MFTAVTVADFAKLSAVCSGRRSPMIEVALSKAFAVNKVPP